MNVFASINLMQLLSNSINLSLLNFASIISIKLLNEKKLLILK